MGLVFFACQKKTPARLTKARRAGVISLRAYSELHHTDNVRNTNPAIKRILKALLNQPAASSTSGDDQR